MNQPRLAPLLFACALTSGACGLIYELVWIRQFSLVMGQTVYALSAVLTAFLAGLAIGAQLAARFVARRRATLGQYGAVEVGIALCALALPFALELADVYFGSVYRSLGDRFVAYNLAQFVGCLALLLLPTTLMGATLPILCAVIDPQSERPLASSAAIYGFNTVGAAVGVALAGWVLLPAIGVAATQWVAVAGNLVVAGVAFVLARRATTNPPETCESTPPPEPTPVPPSPETTPPVPVRTWIWIIAYGAAGFASLTLQVAWSRLVGLTIGSTHHGFTVTLFTFIAGLGLGGLAAKPLVGTKRDPHAVAFWLAALIAVSSLGTLSVLGVLPAWSLRWADLPLETRRMLELGLVWATIIIPTLAMGALLPVVSRILSERVHHSGRSLGLAYATNTWGNIAGAFVAGFYLVPTFGMQATLSVAAFIGVAVALAFTWAQPRVAPSRQVARTLAVVVVSIVIAGVAPDWNRELIASGPYVYGRDIAARLPEDPTNAQIIDAVTQGFGPIVDYAEGPTTVTTVRKKGEVLFLQTGGKSDATNFSPVQEQLAHTPLAIHGAPKEVLVIGLGGGATLASTLEYPIESVECLEIAPSVVTMARKHFTQYLAPAVTDERCTLRIGDGRNHLRHSGRTYDVIISQPSSPWVSGSSSLFTAEFFRLVRSRLNDRGVACSWFSGTDERGEVMRSVLASWLEVFPTAYVFETRAFGSYLLIGFADDRPIDLERLRATFARPELRESLATFRQGSPVDFLRSIALSPTALPAFVADIEPNTDDNGRVEFTADWSYQPEQMLSVESALRATELQKARNPGFDLGQLDDGERAQWEHVEKLRRWVQRAQYLDLSGRPPEWHTLVARIQREWPWHPYLTTLRAPR